MPGGPPSAAASEIKLKPLHWRKIPNRLIADGSVWSQRTASKLLSAAELAELKTLFAHKKARDLSQVRAGGGVCRGSAAAGSRVEVIPPKRAQNIGICLTGVTQMPFELLAKTIGGLNALGVLGWEEAQMLARLAPTDEEATLVRGLQSELGADFESKISDAELFLYHMSSVPSLERKLQVVVFMQLFGQLVSATRTSIDELHRAARKVLESKLLRRALHISLRVGNELNAGTARGNAIGFHIDVLPSLAAMKSSQDTQLSLMHFLARIIDAHLPDEEGDDAFADADAGADLESSSDDASGSNALPAGCTAVECTKGGRVHLKLTVGAEAAGGSLAGCGGRSADAGPVPARVNVMCSTTVSSGGPEWSRVSLISGDAGCSTRRIRTGAVSALREELSQLPSTADGVEILQSIEIQLVHLRSEIAQAQTELTALPPVPSAPTLLEGGARVTLLSETEMLLSFSADEVCLVHWELLSAYRKEPSLSRWGQPQRWPTAAHIKQGVSRDGRSALAHGSVTIRAAEVEHHVLLRLPKCEKHYCLFAVVEDAFGWEVLESGAAANQAIAKLTSAQGDAQPWRVAALRKLLGSATSERLRDVLPPASPPSAPADVGNDVADGTSAADPSEVLRTPLPRGCKGMREDDGDGDTEPPPTLGTPQSGQREGGLGDVVRVGPALIKPATASPPPELLQLLRPHLRSSKLSRPLWRERTLSGGYEHAVASPSAWRKLHNGGALDDESGKEDEGTAFGTGQAGTDSTPTDDKGRQAEAGAAAAAVLAELPSKGFMEGLHSRFLLEEFLAEAEREHAALEAQFEQAMQALTRTSSYLCAQLGSQAPAEQTAVLGVLREFVLALAKCDDENKARARAAAQSAQQKEAAHKEPGKAVKRGGGAVPAAAPAAIDRTADPALGAAANGTDAAPPSTHGEEQPQGDSVDTARLPTARQSPTGASNGEDDARQSLHPMSGNKANAAALSAFTLCRAALASGGDSDGAPIAPETVSVDALLSPPREYALGEYF